MLTPFDLDDILWCKLVWGGFYRLVFFFGFEWFGTFILLIFAKYKIPSDSL